MTYRLRNQLVRAEEAKSVIAANRIQQLEAELARKDEVLMEIETLAILTKFMDIADKAREALNEKP